ncbi:MAG: S-methyl-5'-thioadenosine phosphorylase [Acidobacteriota bacterium]
MPLLGVIGGSGLYDIPDLEITSMEKVSTPFGDPSDAYRIGKLAGREAAFLPRHGAGHHLQPHRINYRANLWGFRELGVEKIVSVCATGGINPEMGPGTIAVPEQIIDMTSGRMSTFYDGDEVVHVDFTRPFCPDMRNFVAEAAAGAGLTAAMAGVYICVNGPRLETAAEIRTFAAWGADMVGMTLMPEACLARELGMCFTCIAVVTNAAAGIAAKELTAKEVLETMKATEGKVRLLLAQLFSLELRTSSCTCNQALKEARL